MGEVPPREKGHRKLAGSSRDSRSYESIRRDTPVRRGYFTEGQRELSPAADLQRGYEVAPDQFVVSRKRRLRSLRQATSPDMQDTALSQDARRLIRFFLETSSTSFPVRAASTPTVLFYRALAETQLAALAQVAMHGRQMSLSCVAGSKGLSCTPCSTFNEVREGTNTRRRRAMFASKELDLAKNMSKPSSSRSVPRNSPIVIGNNSSSDCIERRSAARCSERSADQGCGQGSDIMDALRKSLEAAKAANAERKPQASEAGDRRESAQRKSLSLRG